MRSTVILVLLGILLLAGCAHEGTVVRKEFRPLPFRDSLGIEGIYRFEVRDREGYVHRQMVSPEVFANYRVGDYFNDRAQPPSRPRAPGGPQLLGRPQLRTLEEYGTHYREPAAVPAEEGLHFIWKPRSQEGK